MNDDPVLRWLLEDGNPAVKYRTQTELLGETADKAPVIAWVQSFLPPDWRERTGLWGTYYLTAIAECGLTKEEIPLGAVKLEPFEASCADFMRLRALIRLGFADDPSVSGLIRRLNEKQLPDGGFLCLHRLDKMKYTPKSCYKANMHALMFCAECRKKGFQAGIEDALLGYFWKRKLFYRTDSPDTLVLNAREGWRTVDTFYPFEVMRAGLQNIVESFCALGYGDDPRLREARDLLNAQRTPDGKTVLGGTLAKSYLPKERVGKPGKWCTFYTLLGNSASASQNTPYSTGWCKR
ncbi:MAG: hypothetical protein LBR72_06565 [Oscillospiraceae bacterium]|jgi:hypothetical protein|nr:hypothetical protein [Oscillospiraceae bacterium]